MKVGSGLTSKASVLGAFWTRGFAVKEASVSIGKRLLLLDALVSTNELPSAIMSNVKQKARLVFGFRFVVVSVERAS